ncbi:MAG: hypothetical protein Q8T11_11740 [Elusimicrobiota bacterium]|nr:hypothetical protein [Elusimicrobiota bacterium]
MGKRLAGQSAQAFWVRSPVPDFKGLSLGSGEADAGAPPGKRRLLLRLLPLGPIL